MQWNARSAVSNKHSLENFLLLNDIDIALISETWYKPNVNIQFSGFHVIRKDRIDGKAGVAILIRKKLPFKEINLINNFNEDICVCGAKVLIDNKYVSFLSIYRPPNLVTSSNDWAHIFNQTSSPCVIGGDFNAHNGTWGSSKNDNTGSQILNSADDLGLVILNNGSSTRLERPRQQKSVVDISLCSSDIASKMTWTIGTDTLGSDHFPIVMNLLTNNFFMNEKILPKSKWNIDKADWTLYTASIKEDFENLPSMNNTQEKYNFLLEAINKAAELYIPMYKPFSTKARPPPPWWDTNCEKAILERKQSLNNYKLNPTEENYLKCKESDARTKKFLKQTAKNSWIKWCSTLNKNTPSSVLWTQAKKMQRFPTNQSVAENDFWLQDFFNKVAPPSVSNMVDSNNDPSHDQNHFLCIPFNINELESSLKVSRNTAPGYDDIKYPMLIYLPDNAKKFLLGIFNDIYLYGHDIHQLKNVIVVPIPKPGKNLNCPDSYRPISLLSCILKTLERMVKIRLEWWFLQQNSLPVKQFGFRRGFGTIDAASTLIVDIQNCFSKNNYLCALFLDVKGAYDSVDLLILERKMIEHFAIPHHIARSIVKLYSGRIIYIRNNRNEKIGPRTNTLGLPQGSVLSPLLFNLYTANLHHSDNISLNIVQYADDFCVYVEHKKYDKAIEMLECGVANISQWFTSNGFELCEEKSVYSVFTRHNVPNMSDIQLGTFSFPFKTQVKYLGIIFDKKLTWKPFIESITTKCNKGINFLKMVTKTWWGADVKTALVFYKSYIRSIIDYGCTLYGSASKSTLKSLDIIQNKAIRICLGAMKSSPVDALHVEALEPPLSLRREMISERFILKQLFYDTSLLSKIAQLNTFDLTNKYWIKKTSPPLCSAFREHSERSHIIDSTYIYQIDYFSLTNDISIITPNYCENPLISANILQSILNQFENSELIYTDASKSKSGTGGAFIVPSQEIESKFKLNSHSSIFTAEAISVYQALKYVETSTAKVSIILSDSFSVLMSIKKTLLFSYKTNPYLFKIKQLTSRIKLSGRDVIFVWVKAHIGLQYNERVDTLAKEGTNSGYLLNEQLCASDRQTDLKINKMYKWSVMWKQFCFTNPTRYTFIHSDIPSHFWHDEYSCPRKYITTLIRLKLGHACYPAHLFKIGVYTSSNCEECNVLGDLDHVLFGCTKYEAATTTLIQSIVQDCNILAPYNLLSLLSIGSRKIYNCIINFVNQSSRFLIIIISFFCYARCFCLFLGFVIYIRIYECNIVTTSDWLHGL